MIVYRVCQTYPPHHNPIDGIGAFKQGGRWNSKGTYMVYTASSLPLARSELARHINLESLPDDFRVYEIEIPDEDYPEIKPLPHDWDSDPISPETQLVGDAAFSDPNVLAVKVPSVCDSGSFNYLLNPGSNRYHEVKVVRDYVFRV